ncbi:TIR domain-containing protein [Desmonostoc muscorum LEGE 12446]|uniref:TIR domain-containing protein n=1 Tax=Desmonostoc muscorum LEGE 12446 TaxID=1828758 RepID=A0A8J6ZQD3_DESMC|nr:TIR domain-containing protein [Desmonostoc muscorum]MCF2150246.1 TIR domain-containing protein [Desmonostoc muscorum LEGE 12446]
MNGFQDAFISYGRADSKTFAFYLHNRLIQQNLRVWFDQRDIPLGVDFQNQIDEGIEKSDNFLFIISPHSINSPYCRKEIEMAVRCNKRIIPLLHVEEISQETWQQRHPTLTYNDWETYKAQGLHSCFPNMHPAINKINWVLFREGIDDFETSFAGLLKILVRHRVYVHQHTYFLVKALEWERHQKQSLYLLIGEERAKAQTWLKHRFKDEQPPCEPTNLHCTFICEGIKNANNLMTNVFFCYAERDKALMEKIAQTLMRESFTIWMNKTDIHSGAALQETTNWGIEEADNVLYIMSSASLQSGYCQQQLTYALFHHKRVIPLLVASPDLERIPADMLVLQFIDFTGYEDELKYREDIAKLIKVLHQDAVYHEQHKMLLAKALKWERQRHNPTLLLRGNNLRHAETWLKVAKQRSQYLPTSRQEQFIAQSLKQPPEASLDIHICYSAIDSDFARKLNDALQTQGKTTWFDQESIAFGDEFQQEIYQGIENSHNFLFVISPSSINSPDCNTQVQYAMNLNKRMVSVLYREVSRIGDLHPAVASAQLIDFRKHRGEFFTNFGELIRTIDTDIEHVRAHTRVLIKAMEWDREKRDDSFLLRGKDLVTSEQWLEQSVNKQPRATDIQIQYITASRAFLLRKVKPQTVLWTSVTVTVLLFIARFLGLTQVLELRAYDHLMQLRPSEAQDKRFLMIDVDQDSIQKLNENPRYKAGSGTIPDAALDDLLKILNQYQPKVIGLDFIRDFPAQPDLAARLKQTQNLIVVCKKSYIDESGKESKGIKAPLEVPLEQVGFGDFVDDKNAGYILRRHYLMQTVDPESCNTREAFSLVIARRYLEGQNQPYTSPVENGDYVRDMQFGKTAIPQLLGNGGGYQNIDNMLRGYQTMLNYRVRHGDPDQFAQRVSIEEVLNNQVSPQDIQDRIVFIGLTDRHARKSDYWNTPYGDIPGVTLQGQMVSQILSAVLDGRLLIWWWPVWGETLWIFGWSLVGGVVLWQFQRRRSLIGVGVSSFVGLYGICYLALVYQGCWIPLVPPAIALVVTGIGVSYLTYRLRKL